MYHKKHDTFASFVGFRLFKVINVLNLGLSNSDSGLELHTRDWCVGSEGVRVRVVWE